MLLELVDVEVAYGAVTALRGVRLTVDNGEIVTLLGANGAGKTTTLRTISGLLRPRAGQVLLDGEPLSKIPAHQLIRRGVAHSPEGRRIFPAMSVRENLLMGAFHDRKHVAEDLERVFALFPRLKERVSQAGGTLSGGEQQMLAIGRAIMSRPRLLLLDEPSMGLAPLVVQTIFEVIAQINATGVAVLLVEQNAAQALKIANRGYVLETGQVVLEGPAGELLADDRVRQAYLGEDVGPPESPAAPPVQVGEKIL
ncbi:ABC transporter ATP-binding protein [Frankia sp. CNm7]|uniref:ABC transporter ATP-binding protein n=1 Tax=Frankia nepalensis TaxID=1836974 RepID=A0A937UWV3_9ACTN|nr:ABC transporter ATP-binding protein [Frankia nepalensis]MBL7499579.1 ABC transporter ATP-binding protein [Frankia nepalensis]MBL7513068.1 ABC transporter ATP-binding protein [Frankia nepalensis]MBL7522904.1 ABC transporter ATP-binding protein [Frankia nepalensis]MBL7633781.1 ABC transporter ATP-binding protein [Frankia nepalensis]